MDGKVSRRVCPQVALLNAEAARGEKRQELDKELAATISTPAPITQKETTVVDPAATALATYLAFLGIVAPVNILGEWLALIPVLALEVGSAFAGLLAMPTSRTLFRPVPSKRSVAETGGPSETPGKSASTAVFTDTVEAFSTTAEKLSVSDDPSERLVDLLRSSGGTVFGGQRTFAKAISISPAAVNGLLHELKNAGRVVLDVGRNGTRVKLVAA